MQQIQITRPTHPDWSSERLELHETSFHEAGHAVLAALAGTYELGEIDARIGGGVWDNSIASSMDVCTANVTLAWDVSSILTASWR